MNENPPLTAAALITAADAVRAAAAREDRIAQHAAAAEQWRKLGETANITAEDVERFAETVAKLGAQADDIRRGPITYTNRAARRARARAERKRA